MQQSLIDAILTVAENAGALTLAFHPKHGHSRGGSARPMLMQHKQDDSPVTQADLAANQHIVDRLAALTPAIPLVSEELPESESIRRVAKQFWLVDPLDGTREFVSGGDDYTVNIALIKHGEPVWGVVYAPALRQLYWGGRETGSFRRHEGHATLLRVQHQAHMLSGSRQQTVRVVASKSHLNSATRKFIDRLVAPATLVQAGSSLKLCLIAQADADIYPRLGDTAEWDTAAAQAVLEGAGGVVCDLQGQRLSYGKPNVLNPHFVAASEPLEHWIRP